MASLIITCWKSKAPHNLKETLTRSQYSRRHESHYLALSYASHGLFHGLYHAPFYESTVFLDFFAFEDSCSLRFRRIGRRSTQLLSPVSSISQLSWGICLNTFCRGTWNGRTGGRMIALYHTEHWLCISVGIAYRMMWHSLLLSGLGAGRCQSGILSPRIARLRIHTVTIETQL